MNSWAEETKQVTPGGRPPRFKQGAEFYRGRCMVERLMWELGLHVAGALDRLHPGQAQPGRRRPCCCAPGFGTWWEIT